MANLYWVGGTGNWSDATNHWSLSSGGSPGAGNLPTATDDVFFDSASHTTNYTVTIDATTKLCRDLNFAAPASGNVTWAGSVAMTVSGSMTLYSGLVANYTGIIAFNATSGTKTITTAGTNMNAGFNFSGSGGTFQLVDALTIVRSAGTGITLIKASGATFDPNGQKVTINTTSNGLQVMSGAFTFYDLEMIGASVLLQGLQIDSNITVTNDLTLNGASTANRLMIVSNVVGFQRTITAENLITSYTDWKDINGQGNADWDLSAITGGSGDCGGNSNITFTTGATQTSSGTATITWSTHAWSGRIPLPQDDVVISNAFVSGRTITANMRYMGKNVDLSGVTWTGTAPIFSMGSADIYGSLELVSGITITNSASATSFEGRGSHTITTAGVKFMKPITINCGDGTYTLQDALTMNQTTPRAFNLLSGTFLNTGNYSISVGTFSSTTTTMPRALTMGSATWTITGTSGTHWGVTSSNLTLDTTGSTIHAVGTLAGAMTFAGGSLTYNNYTIATTPGAFTNRFTGSNTFNVLHIDASAAASNLTFTASTTTTVANMTRDAGTNVITIGTITSANHSLAKSGGGVISLDYLAISRSQASPGSTWYAGANSTDNGNNTGWIFTVPPATNTGNFFLFF